MGPEGEHETHLPTTMSVYVDSKAKFYACRKAERNPRSIEEGGSGRRGAETGRSSTVESVDSRGSGAIRARQELPPAPTSLQYYALFSSSVDLLTCGFTMSVGSRLATITWPYPAQRLREKFWTLNLRHTGIRKDRRKSLTIIAHQLNINPHIKQWQYKCSPLQ